MSPLTSRLRGLVVVAVALSVAGCSGGGAVPSQSSASGTSSTASAEGCPAPTPSPAPVPTPSSGTATAAVVTPAELCALDGRAWQDTVFTFVTNSPEWGDTTPACDEARVAAYWDVRERVQPAITSIDLVSGDADNQRSLGFVGVAVIPRAAASDIPAPTDQAAAPDTDDPATAVALMDAEVEACLEGSAQSALEHGPWSGVRGPFSGDDGELLTWWTAGDDSWAFVQAFVSDSIPPADAAEFEAALTTVLDAQADRIGA